MRVAFDCFFRSAGSPFALDLRAVAMFRIGLGLVLLAEQLVTRLPWLDAFHGMNGVVPASDREFWYPYKWSLYLLTDLENWPWVLEAVRLLATFTLILGIRARLSALVLFLILLSAVSRLTDITQAGDRLLVVLTFFAVFLPLAEAGSLQSLWLGRSAARTRISAGTTCFTLQVAIFFFMAGVLKTGEQWWGSGTAISMALHLESFVTETGRLWRDWFWLSKPLTYYVFGVECLAPFALLMPSRRVRLFGWLALASVLAGIALNMAVGLFPAIAFLGLVALLPSGFFDKVAAWRRRGERGAGLTMFYDAPCRFCAFACRLLAAVGGLGAARIAEAQSNPGAALVLKRDFSWSVSRRTGPDERTERQQGWDAVLFVLRHSRRPWLRHFLPGPEAGGRLYLWIARHRGFLGALGRACLGSADPPDPVIERVGAAYACFCLILAIAWNIATYPAMRDWRDWRPYIEPAVTALGVIQFWEMFAPYPYSFDRWHMVVGMDRDGVARNSLTGKVMKALPTPSSTYGSYRWRKLLNNLAESKHARLVSRYFCRTGDWAAVDIWTFRRRNPGIRPGGRAAEPYRVLKDDKMNCAGYTNAKARIAFRAHVRGLVAAAGIREQER